MYLRVTSAHGGGGKCVHFANEAAAYSCGIGPWPQSLQDLGQKS